MESELKGLMDTIYKMRGLHVVTRIVDEDKINDDSGENQWELCFTCSCCEWLKHGFCVDVQMVAHWYDWGWPGANVDKVLDKLPSNTKGGRPRRAAAGLCR